MRSVPAVRSDNCRAFAALLQLLGQQLNDANLCNVLREMGREDVANALLNVVGSLPKEEHWMARLAALGKLAECASFKYADSRYWAPDSCSETRYRGQQFDSTRFARVVERNCYRAGAETRVIVYVEQGLFSLQQLLDYTGRLTPELFFEAYITVLKADLKYYEKHRSYLPRIGLDLIRFRAGGEMFVDAFSPGGEVVTDSIWNDIRCYLYTYVNPNELTERQCVAVRMIPPRRSAKLNPKSFVQSVIEQLGTQDPQCVIL